MSDTLDALIMSCQREGQWFTLHFYPSKSRMKWVATAPIHPTNCKTLELETGWCECTEKEKQMEGSGKTPEIAASRLSLALTTRYEGHQAERARHSPTKHHPL